MTVYFINTITGIERNFNSLCESIIDRELTKKHISDESLIMQILASGGITKHVRRRFFENVISAEQGGADIIQVTCSSVTPLVQIAGTLVDVPVLPVDAPMAEEAVGKYCKIGVMATNPGTLKPSIDLLREKAEKAGRKVEIYDVLCGSAYDALLAGDTERHDNLILEELKKLMKKCDVVVLAQASMARVADMLEERDRSAPVLTSPERAVRHLAKIIGKM